MRNKICPTGIPFLKVTNSTFNDEAKWNDIYKGEN